MIFHDLASQLFPFFLLLLSPVPSPPSGVMVSQNGLNSLLVTWIPSAGPAVTGYTIFYQQQDGGESGSAETWEIDTNEGESGSVEVGETDTSVTITGLMRGATYALSIVANSNTLPSKIIAGPDLTISR